MFHFTENRFFFPPERIECALWLMSMVIVAIIAPLIISAQSEDKWLIFSGKTKWLEGYIYICALLRPTSSSFQNISIGNFKAFWSSCFDSKPMQKASFDHFRRSKEFLGQVIRLDLTRYSVFKVWGGGSMRVND